MNIQTARKIHLLIAALDCYEKELTDLTLMEADNILYLKNEEGDICVKIAKDILSPIIEQEKERIKKEIDKYKSEIENS